jgi:hypothetical protein
MLVIINLAIGFGFDALGAGIDNAAHVGGLVAGLWLGFVLPPIRSTLASYWSRPVASPGAPGASVAAGPIAGPVSGPLASADRRLATVLRWGGALAVGVLSVAAVVVGAAIR